MKLSLILALLVGVSVATAGAVLVYVNYWGGEPNAPEFTVSYDVNGGNADGPAAVTNLLDGTTVTLSSTGPTHADDGTTVLFVGWSLSQINMILEATDTPTLSSSVFSVTIDGDDVTVYAIWGYDSDGNGIPDVSEFTLSYDVNGGITGSGPIDAAVVHGTTVTLSSTVPTHADVSGIAVLFVGWSTTPVTYILEAIDMPTLSSLVTEVMIRGADATVYAVWGYDRDASGIPDVLDVQFSVTYDVNSGNAGSGPIAVTHLLDGKVVTLSSGGPTHAPVGGVAVLFVGWSSAPVTDVLEAADTGVLSSLVTVVTINGEDATVYAVWGYDTNGSDVPDVLDDQYSVTYDVNGGNADGPADVTHLLDGAVVALSSTEPTHEDDGGGIAILFVGWSSAPAPVILEAADTGALSSLVTSVTISGADATVYAVWGYDRDASGTPDVLDVQFSVKYNVNGGNAGTGPTDVTHLLDGAVVTLSSGGPTHEDYDGSAVLFVGWSTTPVIDILVAADTSMLSSLVTVVTINGEDATVYAVWGYDRDESGIPDVLDVQFSVIHDVNGGNAGTGPTDVTHLLDGAVVTLSSGVPTHAYDSGVEVLFVGWSLIQITTILEDTDTAMLSYLVTKATISGADVTVYAVWGYDRDANGIPDVLEV